MSKKIPLHEAVTAALKRFRQDARGGAITLFAGGLLMVFGFGALAIDVGSFFYAKRQLQTANDLAALAAAADPTKAGAAARATASRNGYEATAVETFQPGVYNADPAQTPAQRFQPSPVTLANAVKVTMRAETPLYFGRLLVAGSDQGRDTDTALGTARSGTVALRSSAIAAQDRQAAFAIGSRLARIEGGIMNSLLSALFGGSLSLSAMDYQALATARVDMFDLSKRLATRANLNAVSFDDVLQSQVRLPDLIGAIQDASRDHETRSSAATAALGRIASAAGPSRSVGLRKLVSFDALGDRPLSGPSPIAASLSALDLVSTVAQVSNGTRQIDVGLGLDLPGIAAATLKLGIGERPVGAAMIRVGRLGASVYTAQTRLLLTVDLVGSGQATLVRLPLYLELGSATARLASVSCTPYDVTSSRVTLAVRPALVDAWIGQVSAAQFETVSSPPNPSAAALLNVLGLARVTGRAHATMTNTAETSLAYSYAEIQRGEKRTTSTQNFTATLLARLVADLDLKVEALGLGIGLGGLADAVRATIGGATGSLDRLFNGVLGTLGIGLGQADTWVTGVRCGGAVLVQ